ncbi:MAG: hypothetical protein AAF329_17240 [Cyanobacteria bacterium P01_A01_bin.17]
MARYTCSVTVAVALANLYPNITELLKSCSLEVLIFREDYLMAREKPGQVPFTKLATVEVLVDSTRSTMHAADFELVVKNEELPLQSNNHCSQVYQNLLKQSAANPGWRLLSCSDQDFAVDVPASEPQPAQSPPPAASVTVSPSAASPEPSAPSALSNDATTAANSSPPETTAAPSAPLNSDAAFVVQEAPEQLTSEPSHQPKTISDPSRFTSLPKVAPRSSPATTAETAATNGGTSQSSANGAKLTWKPVSPDAPQSRPEPPKVDPSSSFEEFLAAGKSAEPKPHPDQGSQA